MAGDATTASTRKLQPALVLLHGLGETRSTELALKAWSDLYGLRSSIERLMNAPVVRTLPNKRYLDDARLERINRWLARRQFVPPVVICPVTPRPSKHRSRERLFEVYAEWIEKVLLPAASQRIPFDRSRVGLDGCSMGGHVATEVFIRRASVFRSFGTVQSAIGAWRTKGFSERMEAAFKQVGARPVHLQTSSADPFRGATEQWSKELARRNIDHQLDVIPGPHDQPWLREVGTLEMLRWHCSVLRSA